MPWRAPQQPHRLTIETHSILPDFRFLSLIHLVKLLGCCCRDSNSKQNKLRYFDG
ncbi:hypothetical protein RchiOBHm_Chr5g0054741 [Rosa chinensis]|uniref:Uncharacterized protein n=1 Tax=Rosa chinensis TaxID=74649 RepID=A0A2P6QG84_ROSCH|nr:hypothetical protein RchiOBHm_Chr5g0054741 [Rosa chinensis]